jgi:hypothetical protein
MRIDGPQITGSFNLNGDTIGDLDTLVTTSSLNAYTSSMDTTIGHVNTATHSLNTFTSSATTRLNSIEGVTGSYATTGSNLFKGTQTLSGSLIPAVDNTYDLGSLTNQFRDLYLSSASLYIDGTKVLSSTTQELQITTDAGQSFKILEAGSDTITLQSNDGNITLATSGGGDVIMDPTTGIIALKGTTTIYAGNRILSSDGNAIQFGNSVTISGSLLATGTNIISGSGQLTGFGFATTGSNAFIGTQTITGSLFISSDLVVQGSSSLQNITASAVNIGANIVNLNTANPAIRFAGINVFDSGSIGGSGSFLYDAVQDEFIFVHRGDNSNITSSVVLMGPQTYNNIGSETYPTNNRILKGNGNEHIGDSIMSEIGGGIGISGSLSVTGSITASSSVTANGSLNGFQGGTHNLLIDWSSESQVTTLTNTNLFFGTNAQRRMTILAGGNVGIGTDSPSARLTILTPTSDSTVGFNLRAFATGADGERTVISRYTSSNDNNWANSVYRAWAHIYETNGGERMRIFSDGNISISNTPSNAGFKLDVNGTGRFSGNLRTDGVLLWNSGIGALSFGSGFVTMETNSSTQIRLVTNGSTALTLGTNQAATFSSSLQVNGGSRLIGSATVGSDTNEWVLSGVGNGGAIFQKTHSGAGGPNDRYLRLGNVDNNGTPNYVMSIVNSNTGFGTTSPSQRVHIDGQRGQPATGGTTQNGLFRIQGGSGVGYGESLDMGFHVGIDGPPSYGWLQSTNSGSLGVVYNLCLNPNGGNVGVGITTPSAPLTVRSTGATGILLEQDGSNSAVSSRLVARNNSVTGTIRYDSGGWRFNTNATIDATSGTERALISTDGYFRMLSGTGGVQFGGNTAASNALNAYEEGTWTPTILGATGQSTYPGNRSGWYTRVGRLVTVTWFVTITRNNMTGTLQMSGLPFTLMSGGNLFYPQGTVLLDNLSTATNNITFQGAQNSSSGDFIGGNGSTATHTGLPISVLGTGTMECRGTLTYFTS